MSAGAELTGGVGLLQSNARTADRAGSLYASSSDLNRWVRTRERIASAFTLTHGRCGAMAMHEKETYVPVAPKFIRP